MPTSQTMTRPLIPSEVRACILEQHKTLRRRLVELQARARDVTLEPIGAFELQKCLRSLLVEFAAHLEGEEEILLPVIETIDALGPERAQAIRSEHMEQRAFLRQVYEETSGTVHPLDLAVRVDRFVLRIFRDMTDEERDVLREDLLRDDVIVVDQFCG